MVHREELDNYCNKFLCVKNFKDYGPNGLQIEGSDTIDKIISGVSANLDLIELRLKKMRMLFLSTMVFFGITNLI